MSISVTRREKWTIFLSSSFQQPQGWCLYRHNKDCERSHADRVLSSICTQRQWSVFNRQGLEISNTRAWSCIRPNARPPRIFGAKLPIVLEWYCSTELMYQSKRWCMRTVTNFKTYCPIAVTGKERSSLNQSGRWPEDTEICELGKRLVLNPLSSIRKNELCFGLTYVSLLLKSAATE